MMSTAPVSYGQGSKQIEDLMERGVPFDQVEDVINIARFSSDEKAALWLLAWSLRDPILQRQDARLWADWVAPGSGRR